MHQKSSRWCVQNWESMARHANVANVGQMFVFGEVLDPNPETVNLVEDIVRSQIIELVSRLSMGCNFTPSNSKHASR
jgi:hypothetical protein